MKVGLFIPCYINAVYPQVGVASFKLLKSLGVDVDYPLDQTCCGQPMANAGFENEAVELARRFDQLFEKYDYIVGPSASCVVFVRDNYGRLLAEEKHRCASEGKVYDICEFIHDVVKPASLQASFPHKVSIQNSCHGVRLMHLSSPSELNIPYYNKLRDLLSLVKDIEIVEPERPDECCGFGGMFAVEEHAVSGQMGRDKVQRHLATGAEYIVGADSSCLMHQNGIIARENFPINKNIDLFVKHGIYTEGEINARAEIHIENYTTVLSIEAKTMVDMIRHEILPAVSSYSGVLCARAAEKKSLGIACGFETSTAAQISGLADQLSDVCGKLEHDIAATPDEATPAMVYSHDVLTPDMQEARRIADQLETLTAKDYWPFPVYSDLLFSV